jgi:hypothetical protein
MRIIRPIIVALLAALTLGTTLPDLARVFGDPVYEFGYRIDFLGSVTDVETDSPAAKAGIRQGDRLDILNTPRARISAAYIGGTIVAHDRAVMAFMRDGKTRLLSLTADLPEPAYSRPLVLARELAGLVFVLVGAMLVLLRPGPMTWGFYLFCCGFNPAPSGVFQTTAPLRLVGASLVADTALFFAGLFGLVVFALRFPSGDARNWRIIAERICLACIVPLAALALGTTLEFLLFNSITTVGFAWPIATAVSVSMAVVALFVTYRTASSADRSRLRWVVVGSSVTLFAFCFDFFTGSGTPYYVRAPLEASSISMPLAIAYAVIRHRVIDINFVFSRALVYAILTTLIVVVFALLDWVMHRVLEQTKIALAAEIVAALCLGFWMNGLHRRVNAFIDSTLFRQRYLAARQLTRAAVSLPHAASAGAVDEMLVGEPVDALRLASAAIFRAGSNAEFARAAAVNWPDGSAQRFDPSEQLVMLLQGELGPLRLEEIRWPRPDLPRGLGEPVLAVPVLIRHRLIAIGLYGSHTNGEALDPDEVASIDRLAAGAAAAYDHLEAEALRREIECLRAQVEIGANHADRYQ